MPARKAEHIAQLVARATEHRQATTQLLELPIYDPTYDGGLRTAAQQICKRIDVSFAADRNDGSLPGI
jgi:dihydrolipoamide dehydrogenase